jgi:hypothetical protein
LEGLAARIFDLHPRIRYAGLIDEGGRIYFSIMRPGIRSYTPNDITTEIGELDIPLVTSLIKKASAYYGTVRYITVEFSKIRMFIIPRNQKILQVTAEPDFPTNMVTQVVKLLEATLH